MKKVLTLGVVKPVKSYKELFRERAVGGLAYSLSNGKHVYVRELIYYGLKGTTEKFGNVEFLPFEVSFEALLKNGEFSLPQGYNVNRNSRLTYGYVRDLREIGKIEVSSSETSNRSFYRWLMTATHELASEFRNIGERLEELEGEYCVDLKYLSSAHPSLKYEEIKSRKRLPSDREIDILEGFFGRKIINRWKFSPFENLLYSISEGIYEGWEENERIKQRIKERNIEIPKKFKARIIAPQDLLKNSYLTCDQIVVCMVEPLSLNEIKSRIGYRWWGVYNIVKILESYGIVEKIGNKYALSSLHPFEIAIFKLSNKIENYRKFKMTLELYKLGLPISEISKEVDVPLYTIKCWVRGTKPNPISAYTANLLMRVGITNSEEIELFKHNGLIR